VLVATLLLMAARRWRSAAADLRAGRPARSGVAGGLSVRPGLRGRGRTGRRATLLTETARIGRRGRLASLVMTGAALGTALGAVAWILVQLLPEPALLSWVGGWCFLSSLR